MLDVLITIPLRIRRPGGVSLLAACLFCSGWVSADDTKSSEAEQTSQWIRELDHESYAVRSHATEELAKAGPEILPSLTEALKTGSLERRLRLVDLIGQIYSVGDETSFDQAELALEAISAAKSGSLRSRAVSVLEANAELRERFAVAAIRRLGGAVGYQSPNRIQGVIDTEPDAGKAPVLTFVVLTKDWSGGDEGLWHLHRLPPFRLLYRVKTAKVSDEAIDKLIAELGVQVQLRGAAKLGIANGAAIGELVGCTVGEVTPGGAADKAGIQQHDVITHFDKQPVKNFEELIDLIGKKQPGDIVPITAQRNSETLELNAELIGW